MRSRQLDAGAGGVDEVHERRGPSQPGDLLAPQRPHGFSDVGESVVRVAHEHGVRRGHLSCRQHVVVILRGVRAHGVSLMVVTSFGSPHTHTLRGYWLLTRERPGSFAPSVRP